MISRWMSNGAACVVVSLVAGCATPPPDYRATLPTSDPKWATPQCQAARQAEAAYEDKRLNVGVGILMGPYGLAMAAASAEAAEKRRTALARDVHLSCSSQPLPRHLEPTPA